MNKVREGAPPAGDGLTIGHDDLRPLVGARLSVNTEAIATDTVAIFTFSGTDALDAAYCTRIGQALIASLALSVRDGGIQARAGSIADLHQLAGERNLACERLFAFAYLVERTALDELALDERFGATSEPWPIVAQMVRRASFDLLAAFAERTRLEPAGPAMTDRLTTLYSRAMFDTALAKEVVRSSRRGHGLTLLLFDVDHLSRINEEYGYGVGDMILERLGILARRFFRHHDWVARYEEDAIGVLLIGTDGSQAGDLAENFRKSVEERLEFIDHRSDLPVKVTVSAAVVDVSVGDVIDPDRLIADAEQALDRAKTRGRNRVERVAYPSSSS